MIKNKKIYLGVLSAAVLTAPVMSVVSCGENSGASGGENKLFDQVEMAVMDRLNLTAKTDSTYLAFNNSIFAVHLQNPLTDAELGLIFANGAMPVPSLLQVDENYYVTSVDATIPSVSIQASFGGGENSAKDGKTQQAISSISFTSSVFFTITNFETKFDLSNFTSISPMASDQKIMSEIPTPSQTSALQINNALTAVIQEYLNEQCSNLTSGTDYDIANLRTIDNGSITDDNLMENARSFKADVGAKDASGKVKNQTTVIINLPKLDLLNLNSTLSDTFTSTKGDWSVDTPNAVASSYVIKIIKKQILELINNSNVAVSWDDLLSLFYTSDGNGLPQTIDLTSEQTIDLYLVALPYSKNAISNKEITITLPVF